MFNIFKRKKETYPTWNDIPPLDSLNLPLAKDYPAMPQTTKPNPKDQTEFFRVGITQDGYSTLTLIDNNGYTMTITLSKEDCQQMIRMLKSTMEEENE